MIGGVTYFSPIIYKVMTTMSNMYNITQNQSIDISFYLEFPRISIYATFTLDTETETETKTDTETDTLAQNPMRICIGVYLCAE